MTIRLITGSIGSGKTYLAVKTIVDNYYEKTETGFYKPKNDKLLLVTNIEDLKLDHSNLSDIMKASNKDITSFFTTEFQTKISEKYKQVVYVIDEAQRYFRTKFYDTKVFEYFEYSRHFGHDIYLISQDKYRLCRQITDLHEIEIRAVRRTLSLFGEFKYKTLSNDELISTKAIKPSKDIYQLYKSMYQDETIKVKKVRTPIYIGILLLLGLVGIYQLSQMGNKAKSKAEKSTSTSTTQSTTGSKEESTSRSKVKSTSRSKEESTSRSKEESTPLLIKKELSVVKVFNREGRLLNFKFLDPKTNALHSPKDFPYTWSIEGSTFYALLPPELIQKHTEKTMTEETPPQN